MPPQQIRPTVDVRVAVDQGVNAIMLEFVVGNEANASTGIERFGIANLETPIAQLRPAQWLGFYGYQGNDSAFVWAVVDTLTQPPPNWPNPLYPSPYAIDPGDTTHTFQVYMLQLPTILTYYAQGFDTVSQRQVAPTLFESGWSGSIDLRGISLAIEEKKPVPRMIEFHHPTPNPAREAVSIGFALPKAADVRLVVMDVGGRVVRTLRKGRQELGVHAISWNGTGDNGRRCSPGAYFVRLQVDGEAIGSQKVVLLQ